LTKSAFRTFVLTGDGEMQEGSNWEAAMTAGNRRLNTLTWIVDRNRLQQGAGTEETNGLDPLDKKFEAFGWDVAMVDGHDPAALLAILSAAPSDRPRAVIANTVKGKGVSFMENKASWHHGVPNADQFSQAMKELV
jgi:transketolase